VEGSLKVQSYKYISERDTDDEGKDVVQERGGSQEQGALERMATLGGGTGGGGGKASHRGRRYNVNVRKVLCKKGYSYFGKGSWILSRRSQA